MRDAERRQLRLRFALQRAARRGIDARRRQPPSARHRAPRAARRSPRAPRRAPAARLGRRADRARRTIASTCASKRRRARLPARAISRATTRSMCAASAGLRRGRRRRRSAVVHRRRRPRAASRRRGRGCPPRRTRSAPAGAAAPWPSSARSSDRCRGSATFSGTPELAQSADLLERRPDDADQVTVVLLTEVGFELRGSNHSEHRIHDRISMHERVRRR